MGCSFSTVSQLLVMWNQAFFSTPELKFHQFDFFLKKPAHDDNFGWANHWQIHSTINVFMNGSSCWKSCTTGVRNHFEKHTRKGESAAIFCSSTSWQCSTLLNLLNLLTWALRLKFTAWSPGLRTWDLWNRRCFFLKKTQPTGLEPFLQCTRHWRTALTSLDLCFWFGLVFF